MTRPTARQRALDALRVGTMRNDGWVSGNFLAIHAGYRFGARIHELRTDGYVIERSTDPRSAVDQYRLVESVQLELPV